MAGSTKSPGVVTGAAIGVLLTAALTAVFYLGWQAAGLPFAPFDVFDWMARVLPGSLITRGIDTMVAGIRALGIGEISSTAKKVEQATAIVVFLLLGLAAGGLLYAVLPRRRSGSVRALWAGPLLGVVGGVLLLLVSLRVNETATVGPVIGSLWIFIAVVLWGAFLGWAYRRLGMGGDVAAAAGPWEDPGATDSSGRRAQEAARGGVAEPAADALDRRRFIVRLGGAAAVITVAGGGVGAWVGSARRRGTQEAAGTPWSATHPLPNADATVQPVKGTRPELTPVADHYRIDINTRPPTIREDEWRLRVGGLVERPSEWSLADLRDGYDPLVQFITLSCISNPIGGSLTGTQRWTGVSVRRLLEEVGPQPTASHLRVRAADSFFEIVPLEHAMSDERIMLTYAWDGLPLPAEHGFPLRIYVPDRYGMKQPKWIESIELIDHDEEGYWVRRGWDKEARMKATSVIDVVGVDMMIAGADETTIVPVGGIAHAGDRGISRVQVQVDDGEWSDAELREPPLSDKTWVLWRFGWPFQSGDHTFTVRCFEGDGTPQIATPSPVAPSGATGLDHEEVML